MRTDALGADALEAAGFEQRENHCFPGYDPWAETELRGSAAGRAYRSTIDLLFRVSGKQTVGVLVATGRKPH